METNNKLSLLEVLNLQLFAEEDNNEDIEDDDKEEESLDENDFEDEDDKENKEPSGDKDTSKKKQSREKNSIYAQQRREKEQKEREEKLKREAYVKGQLDSTKINSFTGQPIEDEYDLKIYQLQQKIKANGGDPIDDLPKELARLDRENAQSLLAEKEKERERNEKMKEDIKNFQTQFPKVDAVKLMQDKNFELFSKNRIGEDSLADIYKEYNEIKKAIIDEYKQQLKEKEEKAKAKESTPSSSSIGKVTKEKSYLEMTKEERIEHLRKNNMI